jgi:O-antigen/teichoic acid export membrane protein
MRVIKNKLSKLLAAAVSRAQGSSSRHTLATNIIQQFCAALIILYLPNILTKTDYAQVVFVTVLLSFMAFADFGLSIVYGRAVPALLAQDNSDEIEIWNRTTLIFGLITSSFYSIIIALLYFMRYGSVVNTLLLLPMPFIIFWFTLYVGRMTVRGDFRPYLKVNSWRYVSSLIVFPLAFFYGLTGWFMSQLIAALLGLLCLGKQLFRPLKKPHWPLVRTHLLEGVVLSLHNVLWTQLLYFARLYASLVYKPEYTAGYGIISTAYQSVSTLVISVFLPVGVAIYTNYGKGEEKALAVANISVRRNFLWVSAISIMLILIQPPLFRFCFPAYHFHGRGSTAMLLCVMLAPFFLTYGWLMVARKQFKRYLMLVIVSLLISTAGAWLVDQYSSPRGGAWGQLIGVASFTLLLFRSIYKNAGEHRYLLNVQVRYLSYAFALGITVLVLHALFIWP